jgi:hypothetical protein
MGYRNYNSADWQLLKSMLTYRAIEQLEDIAVPQAHIWELVASPLFLGEGAMAFKSLCLVCSTNASHRRETVANINCKLAFNTQRCVMLKSSLILNVS